MNEWQEQLRVYRLSPAPPKMDDLQTYIDMYLSKKEDRSLLWFLHYYEPILNVTARDIVQRYAMQGHFADIKDVCVIGLMKALNKYPADSKVPFITYKTRIMWREVHRYIRTMRIGFTIPSDDEYQKVRKLMRLYNICKNKKDPDALETISKETGIPKKDVSEILQAAMRNQQFIDLYRQYADEDGEESREEIYGNKAFEPLSILIQKEQSEALFAAYDNLPYREQEVIRMHLGFCPDCFSTKSPKFDKLTFYEIAIRIGLSSAQAAENIYWKGIKAMREELKSNLGC